MEGNKDKFKCHECGFSVITIERDDGITPYVLPCLNKGCDSVMLSKFGKKAVVLGKSPDYELRFPTEDEYEKMSGKFREKVDNGYLLPFRIDKSGRDNSSTALIDHMRRPSI